MTTPVEKFKLDFLFKKTLGTPAALGTSYSSAAEAAGSSKSKIIKNLVINQEIPSAAPSTDLSMVDISYTLIPSGNNYDTKQVSTTYPYIAKYTLKLKAASTGFSYYYNDPAAGKNLLDSVIPFNFDPKGTYSYDVKLDGTTVPGSGTDSAGTKSWILDTDSGYLYFPNSDAGSSAITITFWRYEGTYGVGSSSGGVVTGDLSSNGNLFIAYDTSLNSRLVVGSDATVNNLLFIVGDASLNSRLVVGSDATVNNRLFIVGDASLNKNVIIGKDLTINGRLNVQNYTNTNIINTTVNNYQLIISEDISLNGRLLVSRDSSMNGNLYIAGTLSAANYANSSIPSTAIIGGIASSSSPGDFTTNGKLYVASTAASSSYSTGALVVNGGAGMNGNICFQNNGAGLVWGSNFSQIMDDGDLKIKTDDNMRFFSANTQRITILSSGFVGINNTIPLYSLHVGAGNNGVTGPHRYFTGSASQLTASASVPGNFVAIAGGGAIVSTGFYAGSDKRIKCNIHDFPDIPILELLRYLKPRIFNFIDDIKYGIEPVFGFIAQEVAEIIPNVVTYLADYIPNIYEVAEIIGKEIKLENKTTTELLKDETGYYPLKLKNTKGEDIIVNITEIIDEKTFKIDQEIETEHNKVFLYGQEVPDFHSLDKDQIFTITTAAVQEIDKELQETNKKVKIVQEENQQLKQQIIDITELLEQTSNENKGLCEKIENIELRLSNM